MTVENTMRDGSAILAGMQRFHLALLAVVLLHGQYGLARIGGTASEFERSEFADALKLELAGEMPEGKAYLGKSDVFIALFIAQDGRIIKQRLKWLGDNYPRDDQRLLLTILSFCLESMGKFSKDAEEEIGDAMKRLLGKLRDAAASPGPDEFVFEGHLISFGELDDPSGATDGHLVVEVKLAK